MELAKGKCIVLGAGLLTLGFGAGYFASREPMRQSVDKASQSVSPAPNAAIQPGTAAVATKHVADVKSEGGEVVISEDYKNRLLSVDFANLLVDAKLRRFYQGGNLLGVKVSHIRSGSIYQKVGLVDDDVIEPVNGMAVADTNLSPAQFKEWLDKIPRGGSFVLKVVRSHQIVLLKLRVAGTSPG